MIVVVVIPLAVMMIVFAIGRRAMMLRSTAGRAGRRHLHGIGRRSVLLELRMALDELRRQLVLLRLRGRNEYGLRRVLVTLALSLRPRRIAL